MLYDNTRFLFMRSLDLPKVDIDHLDHKNANTFEMEDLQKLIKKVCFQGNTICRSELNHTVYNFST